MKIKLIRTGGFIPVKKASEAEVNLSGQELEDLLKIIRYDPSSKRIKDGTQYQLVAEDKATPVNLDNVPGKYEELFSKLKGDLKIVK
jgi:hypothetical protein